MNKSSTDLAQFAAFVGIDWADRKHDLCLQVAHTDTREFAVLAHRPDAIDQWAASLRRRFQGRPVAVCLELAKGPLVYDPAEARFPGPVPGQSGNAGEIPPSLHAKSCQG